MFGGAGLAKYAQAKGSLNSDFRDTSNQFIIPTLRYLEGNFVDIFIHGEVLVEGDETIIDVKFKLGWSHVLVFVAIFIASITLLIQFVSQSTWDTRDFTQSPLPLIIIPIALLIVQLNRVGNIVSDLLGAEK